MYIYIYIGGGARERIFWQNYFFHCAFTRYEAGLSVDEIWSYQVQSSESEQAISTSEQDGKSGNVPGIEEETVFFDGSGEMATTDVHAGFQDVEDVMAADEIGADVTGETSGTVTSEGSPNNGFELVEDDGDVGSGDPELDELEAEIARELED
jgi:hypothetical protein